MFQSKTEQLDLDALIVGRLNNMKLKRKVGLFPGEVDR